MVRPFSFLQAALVGGTENDMTKRTPRNFRYDSPARMVATFAHDVARIEDFASVFNEFDFVGVDDVEVETSVEFNTESLTEGADEDVRYSSLIEKIGEVLGVEVSGAQEDDLHDLLSGIAADVAEVIRGRLDEVGLEKSKAGYVVVKATASSISEGLSGALQEALDAARKEAREVERNAIRIHNERVREANAKVLPMPQPTPPAVAPVPAPAAAPVPAPQPEPTPAPKATARKPKAKKADPAPAAPVAAPAAPVAAPAAPAPAVPNLATLPAGLAELVAAIVAAPTPREALQLAYPKAVALVIALELPVAGNELVKAQAVVKALRG